MKKIDHVLYRTKKNGDADIKFIASRTLQFCPFSNNSEMTMTNHVLVTYFTINNKSTFVQIGNLLSQFVLRPRTPPRALFVKFLHFYNFGSIFQKSI